MKLTPTADGIRSECAVGTPFQQESAMLTITVPAVSTRLTTLASVKAGLGLIGGTDDAVLSDLIDRVSATIATHCNRVLAKETVTETFRLTSPAWELMLNRWPVTSVMGVTVAGVDIDAVGYELDRSFLYRLSGSETRCQWPSGKIVVSYQAGYILPGDNGRTLPPDIEEACIRLVRAAWFARNRDPALKSEEAHDVMAATYWLPGSGDTASVPPDASGLLSPYRQPTIG